MERPQTDAAATAMQQQDGPTDLADLVVEAKQRIEAGDVEGGLEAFRTIARQYPDTPEVYNNLGAICAAMGRQEDAEEAFGRAAELTPQAPNPWYNRGLMRFQGGNYLGALEDFQRAGTLDPQDPEFLNNQGVVHFQLQDWDAARDCFARAAELRPEYVAAQLNLVDVDLAQGLIDRAHDRCQELTQRFEDLEVQSKFVECSVARAVEAIGQAQSDCERLQQAHPGLQGALDQAGRLLRAKQILLDDEMAATV